MLAALVFAAAALSPCEKQLSNVEVRLCAIAEMKAYQRDLDKVLTRRRAELDPKDWPDFDAAQTAWLTYRDASCKSATAINVGGSGHDGWEDECWSARTKDRIRELKRLLNGCEAQQTNAGSKACAKL